MIDILASAVGAIVWTGLLFLWWLFRREQNGGWLTLRQYFGWMFLAWTALMLVETCYFLSWQLYDYGVPWVWFTDDWYTMASKLVFRPIEGLAVLLLIRHLLRPRVIDPTPIEVAQIVMDWQGIIRSWNAAATMLLGWTEVEAVGQELAALIIPEDLSVTDPQTGGAILARDAHRHGLRRFRENGHAPVLNTQFRTIALCANGARLAVEVRVSHHITSSGSTFLGTMTPLPLLS